MPLIIRDLLGALVCVVTYSGVFCAPFVLLIIRAFLGALVCAVNSSFFFARLLYYLLFVFFWVRWSVLLIIRGIFACLLYY